MPPFPRLRAALALCIAAALWPLPGHTDDAELERLRSALIPKREVAADQFLKAQPQADGRGVVIAVLDTGVDPAALGLAVTTTGQRKIVDILDATGAGDVPLRAPVRPDAQGRLAGLSGRSLTLPEGLVNPKGEFRLGLKAASELFVAPVLRRVNEQRAALRAAQASRQAAARASAPDAAALRAAQAKAPDDRTRAERDLVARHQALTALEEGKAGADTGPVFDCVLWHDGQGWRVLVDTDEDGDLRNERVLRPFGVAGEYASFGEVPSTHFGVQVLDEGRRLSIVTVVGDHGTHVASIAAGHEPAERARDGIAPGARILSIKIGDLRNGSSSSTADMARAAALLAQHKVDIVNISYGSRSLLQDGRNANARVWDAVTERYDILVVMSAGNNGPALGTAGSAGAEARRVLGVGNYISPEMGTALYGTLLPVRAGALVSSSRGPTKDGDFGVDLMAPGAAIAATSHETLQGAELKNGTSMASPSAAGVAALVLSAARQARLDARPARLRAALMLGASPLPQEEAWTRGTGLVNAPGAWKKLQELQGQAAFGAFYDLQVGDGTFTATGRGVLWRSESQPPRRRVSVRVEPAWPESTPAAQRVAFDTDIRLQPSVPWIKASKGAHLTNGPTNLVLDIDPPPLPPGAIGAVRTAQVDALPAARPALGPLFSVPVTIVQPAPASAFRQHRLETAVELKPGATVRHFVQAPAGADRLRVWVRHRARDTLARSLAVHALALSAQSHSAAFENRRFVVLEPGAEASQDLRLKGGSVAEVSYTLGFAAAADMALDVRLEWLGVGLSDEPVTLTANSAWATVDLRPLADRDVRLEARLERVVHVFLPDRATVVPGDERAEWPPSPATPAAARMPVLRQRFTLDLKAPLTVQVLGPEFDEVAEAVEGGVLTLVHESGQLLWNAGGTYDPAARSITLPKGKTWVLREMSSREPEVLNALLHLPLRLAEPLKAPRALPIRTSVRDRFTPRTGTEMRLVAGRQEVLHLNDTGTDELARMDPRPAHASGVLIVRDSDNREIGRQLLQVVPGAAPSRVTNAEPRPRPVPDARSELERLADQLFDARLAFVREQRGKTAAAVVARRTELLAALRAERPQEPDPVFEQALDTALGAGLASASVWGTSSPAPAAAPAPAVAPAAAPASAAASAAASTTPAPTPAAAVFALLDDARKLAGPEAVAQYFGAPSMASADDAAARPAQDAERKRFTARRETLARIERLRADVLRATGQRDAAWKGLAETRRWEPAPGDKATRALEALLAEQAGHLGLALQAVDAQLREDSGDLKAQQQRAQLLRKLGWTAFADAEDRRLALQAQRREQAAGW